MRWTCFDWKHACTGRPGGCKQNWDRSDILRSKRSHCFSGNLRFSEIVTIEVCLNYSALRKVEAHLMASSSGIGSKSEINHHGTPVGESLCDHVCIQTFWKVKDDNTLIGQVNRSEQMSFHDNEPAVPNDAHQLPHSDNLERYVAQGKVRSKSFTM